MLRQLGPDAPVAEAGLAGMDPRFGEALGREEAVRLEPVEQRLDLRMAAIAFIAGVAARRRCRRRASASAARARASAAAWRSSLPRSSSRLWSRCASSCSARPFSDSRARGRAMRTAPVAAQSLTTLSLAGASASAPGSSGMPISCAHLVLDLDRQVGVLAQELARVVLALADLLAVVGVPGAALLEHLGLDAHVDDLALAADALAVEDVELGGLERRRDLVLDDLDLGLVADDLLALLDRADAADVEPDRGVELEGVAAGGGFGRAEHHADLHPDLVDEDDHGVGLLDRAGELAQRLAHEAGLQAGQRIAHLALDLGLGRERGDRVDDDQVDRGRAHQRVDDLERLLAGVGLGDQQLLQVDAELLRVLHVERVLGVDEGAGAAELLHLGDDLQGERGLAARLRAVDLDHPAARQAADAEGDVEAERAGGDDLDVVDDLALAEAHDRALAELLLDLRQGGLQGLGFFGVEGLDGCIHGAAPGGAGIIPNSWTFVQ